MKLTATLLLVGAANCASSQDFPAKSPDHSEATFHRCILEANQVAYALQVRDRDLPPQSALVLSGSEIPQSRQKQLINMAYFDPRFKHIHLGMDTDDFISAYLSACQGDRPKQYTPLK